MPVSILGHFVWNFIMHTYDFRCKRCQYAFTLHYKTYGDYDRATRACPQCGSAELSRIIKRVAIQAPTRDYTRMAPEEMLSVLESGDSRQVGQMFAQAGGSSPEAGTPLNEATERLLRGESLDRVEQRLQEDAPPPAAPPPIIP